jgi:hypothetical protein
MNEITLLREHGPDSAPATEPALAAARASLMAEIAATRRPGWRRRLAAARPRHLPVRLVGATAAVAVAAVVVAVGAQPDRQPQDPPTVGVSLVAFGMPVFPVALQPVPAGLKAPSFGAEDGRFLAVYLSKRDDSDVYLSVWPRRVDRAGSSESRSVTIDGQRGELRSESSPDAPDSVTLAWQRKPDQWVEVTGNGRLATEAAVRSLAESVVDRPQEIPLRVGLAPAGWKLFAFKDDTILTLKGERTEQTMTVQRVARTDPDLLRNVMGAREVSPVRINGRAGQLVRADDMWFLQATAANGAVFNLQAPLFLTREQVIAIGEQVTVRR